MTMYRSVALKLICTGMICTLIWVAVSAAYCGCSQCASMQGVDVNEREGTVAVLPLVAGVDVGPGAPGRCDAANLPGNGDVRNLGSTTAPNIKWGTSRITLDTGGNLLVDGTPAAGWSWDSSSSTLKTTQRQTYIFDTTTGMLTSSSGPSGLFVTTYEYDSTYAHHITKATDSLGNPWTYGVDTASPGPSYVINPDSTRKVAYAYRAAGTDGEGQYEKITVYKWSGSAWTEQEHTDYTYDSSNRVTQVMAS